MNETYYIEVDPEGHVAGPLPFRDMTCDCPGRVHPICIAYRWGRCAVCGVQPHA